MGADAPAPGTAMAVRADVREALAELGYLPEEIAEATRELPEGDAGLLLKEALRRLAGAFDRLPDRCREVVWLRRVEDLPQKEVAARLGISEKTVEKQVAKGVRLIAEHFYGNGSVRRAEPARAAEAEDGNGHGGQHPD